MELKDKSGRDISNVKKWMDAKPYQARSEGASLALNREKDYSTYWTITPKIAEELLASAEKNRVIRPNRVEQYARDMVTGSWRPEGNEIAISPDGKLLDGQHRLRAIIKIDMPIVCRIHFNVPADTPFDIGAGRSSGDALRLQGDAPDDLTSSKHIAMINATLRAVLGIYEYKKVTNADRAAFINKFDSQIRATFTISANGSPRLCKKAGCQAGIFNALYCGIEEELLNDFAYHVNTGRDITKDISASAVIRDALIMNKYGNRGGDAVSALTWATEQAIADFIIQKPRKRLYSTIAGPYTLQMRKIWKGRMGNDF